MGLLQDQWHHMADPKRKDDETMAMKVCTGVIIRSRRLADHGMQFNKTVSESMVFIPGVGIKRAENKDLVVTCNLFEDETC